MNWTQQKKMKKNFIWTSETRDCAVKKVHEELDVAQMRTLSWICGVTKLDEIRSSVSPGMLSARRPASHFFV